ncbi:Lyzozyme M1 (1,4-beta-N-acetylmuramidase) [Brevibacillus laterosporus]|nr:GH25 family lysozyme [Brevibacillus laterosporus]RAP29081.1 Lyzozyme M1 (1,4-beta-N-acetylmuramidase) [Brevibacillus laterosporus]
MQAKNETNIKGIDVSHHNSLIDWKQVASDGVKYAFIKATEGTGFVDKKLRENATQAHENGIKVSYYHFAHPDMSPQAQANHFLTTIQGLPLDFPVVLDIETTKGLQASQITTFCLAFLTHIKARTDKTPILYTGASFAKTHLGKELVGFPLWVAHYNVDQPMKNNTWNRWAVFQYTDSGKVRGINGNVDMNWMEKEFWDIHMKEETTVDKMLANELILVLKTQWKVSDAMGMKEQAKYLGELADRVRVASGQEPQNK